MKKKILRNIFFVVFWISFFISFLCIAFWTFGDLAGYPLAETLLNFLHIPLSSSQITLISVVSTVIMFVSIYLTGKTYT